MNKTHDLIIHNGKASIKTSEIKSLSDCGCIFFARIGMGNKEHHVYKLHRINNKFHWLAMWNSCVTHSGDDEEGFNNIESALNLNIINKLYRNNLDNVFKYNCLEDLNIKTGNNND